MTFVAFAMFAVAAAQSTASPLRVLPSSGEWRLSLPPGVSEQKARAGDRAVWSRLEEFALRTLASHAPPYREGTCGPVVVFVDAKGVPILPDGGSTSSSLATHDLVYTFNSPSFPWTDSELGLLQAYVTDFYPAIKEIYGDPAVSDTINIVHDPASPYAGYYYSHTMVLQTLHKDVLCHEMVHTFHHSRYGLGQYEEAMARAVEIEVFDRLPQYVHPWDDAHSFQDDVFYESNNTPGIAGWALPSMVLTGYQLAGYAMGKCLIEKSSFLLEFNDTLYERSARNPYAASSDDSLRGMMAEVLPNVEGLPCIGWLSKQQALTNWLPEGDHLYQQVGDWQFRNGLRPYPISSFRMAGGDIEPILGTPIHWEITDWQGALLARGTTMTNASGVAYVDPPIPSSYVGLVRSIARAEGAFGAVADTVYRNFGGDDSGVFGVALDGGIDSVSIVNLDDPGPPVDLPVVRGAFYAPALGPVRGRFEVTHHRRDGTTGSRRFNKDASSYLVMVGSPNPTPDGIDPLAAGHGVLVDQNRPNPFNPFTTISYHVEREARVGVRIFDVTGRLVRTLVDEDQPPGAHEVTWDGTLASGVNAASGVFLYRVDALGKSVTKKMIVMR